MKTNIKKPSLLSISAILATALGGAALVACGDDSGNQPVDGGPDATTDATGSESAAPDTSIRTDAGLDSGMPDTATADTGSVDTGGGDSAVHDAGDAGNVGDAGDAGNPPPPTLGVQIDRFGRPAINTALNHSFDPDASAAGMFKDKYNADNDAGGWVGAYSPEFQKNLAILDSVDTNDAGGGCGNQPFSMNDAGAARYKTLGDVLAADKLWINTASTSCMQYLGVELIATGVLAGDAGVDGGPTNECGGRKLSYDVIQTTYSIAAGVGLSGFGSGVNAVVSKTNGTTFPYLSPPQ